MATIEAEIVGAGAIGERVGVEEVGVEVRDLEIEPAGLSVPIERKEAMDVLQTCGLVRNGGGSGLAELARNRPYLQTSE
jgi:hypothetical protein